MVHKRLFFSFLPIRESRGTVSIWEAVNHTPIVGMSAFRANSTRCSVNSPAIYWEDFYPILPKWHTKKGIYHVKNILQSYQTGGEFIQHFPPCAFHLISVLLFNILFNQNQLTWCASYHCCYICILPYYIEAKTSVRKKQGYYSELKLKP